MADCPECYFCCTHESLCNSRTGPGICYRTPCCHSDEDCASVGKKCINKVCTADKSTIGRSHFFKKSAPIEEHWENPYNTSSAKYKSHNSYTGTTAEPSLDYALDHEDSYESKSSSKNLESDVKSSDIWSNTSEEEKYRKNLKIKKKKKKIKSKKRHDIKEKKVSKKKKRNKTKEESDSDIEDSTI